MQLSRVYDGRLKARGEPFEVRSLPAGFSIRLIKMRGWPPKFRLPDTVRPFRATKKPDLRRPG
jgi:hypothetical protein